MLVEPPVPAVDGQEACHAADGIDRAVDQIDAAIAVEVGKLKKKNSTPKALDLFLFGE